MRGGRVILSGVKETIICLPIPDIHRYMEPASIDELRGNAGQYVDLQD